MGRLDGKVALVTGGTRGIGAATCRTLAREGAVVVATARTTGPGEDLVAELTSAGTEAHFVAHDVSSDRSWAEVIGYVENQCGALHVLVNSAGAHLNRRFSDTTRQDFDRLVAVNLWGVFAGILAALPLLTGTATAESPASVVNVSSNAAMVSFPGESVYDMTKGGLQSLSMELAKEFAIEGRNVRVNTVNPGVVDSPLTNEYLRTVVAAGDFPSEEAARADLLRAYPMGRFATVEDVASTILFLASDEASYLTGGAYVVDGGETA